jgi:uncharacterized caspase-like protein
MKQQSLYFIKRFILVLGLFLPTLLLLVPGPPSTVQEERAEQNRRLQQTEAIAALPGKTKRWALVIGVDWYRDGNISSLRSAANDAGNLATALTQYAGFPADQVILLPTDQPDERQLRRINLHHIENGVLDII